MNEKYIYLFIILQLDKTNFVKILINIIIERSTLMKYKTVSNYKF